MAQVPEALLNSLEGLPGFDRDQFVQVHSVPVQLTSIRINPLKVKVGAPTELLNNGDASFALASAVPWSAYGYYLERRPSFTFDPLFHAGCYYVQEASSMFLEQAFRQLIDLSQPLKVLDLCGAPGGKSTHIRSLISPQSLLVSNEVIRARSHILTENLVKWGTGNVIVTNNDPSAFRNLEGFFDVIVVDAPCSGSGLFRRDEDAVEEWSLNNVALCSQRQQRILADALLGLKENGLLFYSTCSYSREEDEDIADWLVNEWSMESVPLTIDAEWGIVPTQSREAGAAGYRFYPDKLKGEGFFLSCFRKRSSAGNGRRKLHRLERASARERTVLLPWLKGEPDLIRENNIFTAAASELINDLSYLKPVLNIRYQSVTVGQLMKDKLVPDHALALSSLTNNQVSALELDYEQAIRFLQKQDLSLHMYQKGWSLIRYRGNNLGWANVLSNRINNYYPKEWRILKREKDDGFEK